jgi:putative transposase
MVPYEAVRRVNHFGPKIAADLRKRRPKPHTTWHLDEVYLKIDGRMVLSSVSAYETEWAG